MIKHNQTNSHTSFIKYYSQPEQLNNPPHSMVILCSKTGLVSFIN